MSDDLKTIDPWHNPNSQYAGADAHVLNFVKERERIINGINAERAKVPMVESTAVMNEADVRADIGASNAHYAQGALKREIVNSYYNHPLILSDFESGRGHNLDPAQGKGPALIIGSGPTLDKCHDLIRAWRGGLICSSSQCVTILGLGKSNFHVVAVDVKTEATEVMPLDLWEGRGCTLITHPGMDPSIIQTWRWGKAYFRIIVQQMPFYKEILPLAYPMIRTQMYVYGCVLASQVMIATLMGYNPLFLCGADFGYPGGQARFRPLIPEREGEKVNWKLGDAAPARYWRHAKVIYRNGLETDDFTAYYKQTMMNGWRLSLADMFVVGDEGGLYEVPHIAAEEVIRRQGMGLRDRFISNKDKADISERYLLQYGTFTFEYPNGQVEFCVFPEGEAAIPVYVEAVNKALEAAGTPGVLFLGDVKDRLNYLRNDEAWERKEKRWQWAIKSPQSPMETISGQPSESG